MKIGRGKPLGAPGSVPAPEPAASRTPSTVGPRQLAPDPAVSHYTQARAAGTGGAPRLSAAALAGHGEFLSALDRPDRPAAAAAQLADRLVSARPDVKGIELARLHGANPLRRVQRMLAPLVEHLNTALAPAAASALTPPPQVSLSAAQARELRSAAALAAEALRLEDQDGDRLSAPLADRILFQMDLAILGRDLDESRGLSELRSAAQRALGELRFIAAAS